MSEMNNLKHTHGPWEIMHDNNNVYVAFSADKSLICEVFTNRVSTPTK